MEITSDMTSAEVVVAVPGVEISPTEEKSVSSIVLASPAAEALTLELKEVIVSSQSFSAARLPVCLLEAAVPETISM